MELSLQNVRLADEFYFSGIVVGNFSNLKGCMFFYVPKKAAYVCEDQGWYCLVVLVGDYLLVYFLLDCDITSVSSEGYSGGRLSVTDEIFLTEKLYKVPGPDRCIQWELFSSFFFN